MSYKTYLFSSFILLISLGQYSYTQNTKTKLQRKYKKILAEIQSIESQVKKTKAKRQSSIEQLRVLNSKIKARNRLIHNIQEQIQGVDEIIEKKTQQIHLLSTDIDALKEEYAQILRYTYQNISKDNFISFLFTSDNFKEAFNRIQYLRKYNSVRRGQAEEIKMHIHQLHTDLNTLNIDKSKKTALVADKQRQNKKLESEQERKNTLIVKLTKDEKRLAQSIRSKNKAAKKLNGQIQEIIKKEIARARQNAKENKGLGATPKEKALSAEFYKNKGKLPWPVAQGRIIERFGKNPHPSNVHLVVENNGIDIQTNPNADVHSIFGGKVVSVFYLPTNHYSIIIKHGEYFSVYSYLKEVFISKGEMVKTKTPLGLVYTHQDSHSTKTHLEIWKGTIKIDPETWLAH